MEAIILAGGKGTRLQSVVKDVPKPMASINGRPFLDYLLKYLKKNQIKKVVLSVGYKKEVIKKYLNYRFEGVDIIYSIEDYPLDTGGAIKHALSYIESKEVFILNGDSFFNIDLSQLNLQKGSKLILSLQKMQNFDRYGCVQLDNQGHITGFTEKKFTKSGYINSGVYLIRKDIFNGYNIGKKFSFENFMQNNYSSLNATGKAFENYFIDIGIPADYEKAQTEIPMYI